MKVIILRGSILPIFYRILFTGVMSYVLHYIERLEPTKKYSIVYVFLLPHFGNHLLLLQVFTSSGFSRIV